MLKIDAREVFCVCRGSHQVVELRKQIIKKLRILRLSLCDSHSQELCLHDKKTSPFFCSNASNDPCLHFPNKWPFVSWVTHLCHKQQWKDGRFDNVTTLRREVVLNTKWQTLTLTVYSKQSVCFCFFLLFLASFLASKHTHSLTLTLFNSYTLNQMADLKTLLSCI